MPFTYSPQLGRRDLFRVGLTTLAGYHLLPMLGPLQVQAKERVKVRGSAEYCIFLFLNGGAPQLDTWDLKEGPWTPGDFDVRTLSSGIKWPHGQFPKLAGILDKVALARSCAAWESGHARAQYYMQVGHIFSPPRATEMPAVGAVVAYEMQSRQKPSDFLPPFVSINFVQNQAGLVREGCLPDSCGPLVVHTERPTPFVVPPEEKPTFERRWDLLQSLEHSGRSDLESFQEFEAHAQNARRMMISPQLGPVLTLSQEDRARYGNSAFGDGCLLARQLVQAEGGSRYIMVSQNGWDLHANMYEPTAKVNHYTLCRDLDAALPALILDLERTKDRHGESLLSKTLVVCVGEFGRTGGNLTLNKGRDHNQHAMSALFAGGGVKGGQVFGETDEKGVKVTRPDWNQNRPIYPEDVLATIYSVLGIDWSKKLTNTPSGRAFEYIEQMSGTNFVPFGEVTRLFEA